MTEGTEPSHALLALKAQMRAHPAPRGAAMPLREAESFAPLWLVAKRLGLSVAGCRGECSLAGVNIVEVEDYPGIAAITERDAERLIARFRKR